VPGADAEHDASAAHLVDGLGHLRDQGRIPVRRAGDERPQPDPGRDPRQAGEQGPALPKPDRRLLAKRHEQVIGQPERIEAKPLGPQGKRHQVAPADVQGGEIGPAWLGRTGGHGHEEPNVERPGGNG
jgi:hypothetical protein